MKCIFCHRNFRSLFALREHSATCPEHPAVQRAEKAEADNRPIWERIAEMAQAIPDEVIAGLPVTAASDCGHEGLLLDEARQRLAEVEAERDALAAELARCKTAPSDAELVDEIQALQEELARYRDARIDDVDVGAHIKFLEYFLSPEDVWNRITAVLRCAAARALLRAWGETP